MRRRAGSGPFCLTVGGASADAQLGISDDDPRWCNFAGGSLEGCFISPAPVAVVERDWRDYDCEKVETTMCMFYSAVISTIPLPCLGLLDLSGAGIHKISTNWSAIRELQPGPAVKIGIRFSAPWWETDPRVGIHGGQSYTDLPSRTIVYPSYPAGGKPENMSRVLIVGYCRTHDAQRFGGLIYSDGKAEPKLIDQVFRDLAAVHNLKVGDIKKYYKEGDYFAWDWANDPLTLGAFSYFGPGVCEDAGIFGAMRQPAASGKLFFAGEGISASHGCSSGALDSAWRAVNQYLEASGQSKLQKQFHETWGATECWDETPENGFAEEYQKLSERHLVINFGMDGIKPEE